MRRRHARYWILLSPQAIRCQLADLSLSKRVMIRENYNLEVRAEAINVTNTPILNAPNATVPGTVVSSGNIGTGLFGQITSAQGSRNKQFALKFHF